MPAPAELLRQLLETGSVVLRARPRLAVEHHPAVAALLREKYSALQLDVAGPPLAFQADVAMRAAEVTLAACWFLVHHDEPADELQRSLALPSPQSTADHLSADLLLRFLPQVHLRARARAPADTL